MKECDGSSCKLDRKTVEKNRRMHMKGLCFKLATLIPRNSFNIHLPKDALTQQDHLDEAAAYIKQLQKRVEDLKSKKEMAERALGCYRGTGGGETSGDLKLPVVEIRDLDSSLEVVIICGSSSNNGVLFYNAIAVLEEEGAEVVNACFSNVDDKIFCTVHSQVTLARIGLETPRVSERLRQLVH